MENKEQSIKSTVETPLPEPDSTSLSDSKIMPILQSSSLCYDSARIEDLTDGKSTERIPILKDVSPTILPSYHAITMRREDSSADENSKARSQYQRVA